MQKYILVGLKFDMQTVHKVNNHNFCRDHIPQLCSIYDDLKKLLQIQPFILTSALKKSFLSAAGINFTPRRT